MKLIIASNNKHKIEEIKAMLGVRFDVVQGMREAGLELEVDENAETLEGNAEKKAAEVFALADSMGIIGNGDAVLADDTELSLSGENGLPPLTEIPGVMPE